MSKNRRRAVHAELIRESRDNPGYFRYNITIREKDGMEHVVPAYGKDMQDAIERLVWNERVGKVTRSKIIAPGFAVLILSVVALSGMVGDKATWDEMIEIATNQTGGQYELFTAHNN